MVSSGVPLDPKERVIATLEEVKPGIHIGKTTLGRDIRVYFTHGTFEVHLGPWGNVAYCDDYEDRDISLEQALFENGYRFEKKQGQHE